jgi:hypothetical protein
MSLQPGDIHYPYVAPFDTVDMTVPEPPDPPDPPESDAASAAKKHRRG